MGNLAIWVQVYDLFLSTSSEGKFEIAASRYFSIVKLELQLWKIKHLFERNFCKIQNS